MTSRLGRKLCRGCRPKGSDTGCYHEGRAERTRPGWFRHSRSFSSRRSGGLGCYHRNPGPAPYALAEGPPRIERIPASSADIARSEVAIRAGSAHDPVGREGLAWLTADLLRHGGTRAMDPDAFERALAELGAEIIVEVGPELVRFRAVGPAANGAAIEVLLGAMVSEPRFDEAAFPIAVQRATSALAAREAAEPADLGADAIRTWVFRGHPYGHLMEGRSGTLPTIRAPEVRQFYADRYVRPASVGCVVGAAPAGDSLGAALTALPPRLYRDVTPRIVEPVEGRSILWVESDRVDASIHLGRPLELQPSEGGEALVALRALEEALRTALENGPGLGTVRVALDPDATEPALASVQPMIDVAVETTPDNVAAALRTVLDTLATPPERVARSGATPRGAGGGEHRGAGTGPVRPLDRQQSRAGAGHGGPRRSARRRRAGCHDAADLERGRMEGPGGGAGRTAHRRGHPRRESDLVRLLGAADGDARGVLRRRALSVRFPMMTRIPFLLATVALSGCADSGFLPSVSFERIDLERISWQDIDADFVFSVKNPNPLQIDLARFDYDLSFSGIDWVSGNNPDGLVLVASGSSEWALPMHIVFQELYDLVQATKGEDTIPFELQGSFGFDTSIGDVDLPYRAEGGFPALRTPDVHYQALRVSDVQLTTADLALDLGVVNDQGSNLWFKDFDYDVDLSGFDIGAGQVAELGAAEPATTTTLTLPFTVDLLESGAAVLDILLGDDQADLDLRASTDVDTPFGIVPLSIDEHGNVSIE